MFLLFFFIFFYLFDICFFILYNYIVIIMKNKKKIFICLLLIILVTLILLLIDKSTYKEYSRNYFYMDTYINIKINSVKNEKEINGIFDDIDYLYSSYHKFTDKYNQYDDIINVYYLNEILNVNEDIVIDKRLSDIIMLGIKYYDKTDGLFNIASGNLTTVWKNYIDVCDKLPSSSELNVNIDINDIKLDGNTYSKSSDVRIDLGGIAKGYVTEIVGNYLEEIGIVNYIINAGGNVKVGMAYDKDYYRVGITDPINTSSVFETLNINNLSVVTSGDYQRYCIIDDTRYSHIIDPITRYPSNYSRSVTTVCDDSSICDIYSTYLYLLPVDRGLEVVNSISGIEAIWYIDQDNIIRSDNFSYE